MSKGLKIKFVNFWNFAFTTIPNTNGTKTNKSSWINEVAGSTLKLLDLDVITVSQKIIVIGEIRDAKEVKNTDNGTFPLLICASKPDTWPPGTIKTITAAIANNELLKISEVKRPINGNKMSWMPKPIISDFFSINILLQILNKFSNAGYQSIKIIKKGLEKDNQGWEDGKNTAGSHASKVKNNLQLNRESEISKKLSLLIKKKKRIS